MNNNSQRNLYLSVASLIIALWAGSFTGLQWYDSHNQFIIGMKPTVDFDMENDTDDPPVGISINNPGSSPARIISITYYVDWKPMRDVSDVVQYGKFEPSKIKYLDFDKDDTLGVGQKEWLIRYYKKAKAGDKEYERFADFIDKNLAIKVRFCSTLTDDDLSGKYCWDKCSSKGHC